MAVSGRGPGGGTYRLDGPVRGSGRGLDLASVAVELRPLVYVVAFPELALGLVGGDGLGPGRDVERATRTCTAISSRCLCDLATAELMTS